MSVKKKALLVFLLGLLVLGGTLLTEYLFYSQEVGTWQRHFEQRLHEKEGEADRMLALLTDTMKINTRKITPDMLLVGFSKGKLTFWTDKKIGTLDLYQILAGGNRVVLANNTYYDVRSHKVGDTEYFALLKIRDDYPYINNYLKNRFGEFLGIADANVEKVSVSLNPGAESVQIKNKDGEPLFHLTYGKEYNDKASNYILLVFYLLFFLSLFYVYDLLLKSVSCWKMQMVYMLSFVVLLMGIRHIVVAGHLPLSSYRFFDPDQSKDIFISSVGDLLLTAFCAFQVLYLTLSNIRVNYQSPRLKRWRYLVGGVFVILIFWYIDFYNFAIDMMVEHINIHLNIAQLVHVGVTSIVAFVAIIISGLVIVMIIYSGVAVFQNLLSFSAVVKMVTVLCLCLWGVSSVFRLYTNFWDCFFIWIIFLLIAVNKYLIRRDVQRSMYILVIFLLSIYIVMVVKKYERYKEQTQRAEHATVLIEERDRNFEERLMLISDTMEHSGALARLVIREDVAGIDSLLREELLNLDGYNYYTDITLCHPSDTLLLTDNRELWDCREYFESQLRRYGLRIGTSDFYSISDFDGVITYIGRFSFGKNWLYIRFDATRANEGNGYPQILSRSDNERNQIYRYSYAKYRDGSLISSSGDFIYNKRLDALGKLKGNIEFVVKDGYSHMLVPVDRNCMLVVSLRDSIFSLYYMNVLYAFFVCILISSYGLFFNINRNVNFRRGTLKARIKNSIISLIFILLVLLTALSIYLNTKSFERRHNAKATQLLTYINKELERLECLDVRECPDIVATLSEMSEVLLVDINIYSEQGKLVATSRPEIFVGGIDGVLINPEALKRLEDGNTMSYVEKEHVGELDYMSAYMSLVLDNGKSYILNVPYFAQNDELNLDILITVIITVNIAIIMMVLAFILSGIVAERVTKPLQLVNDSLKKMRLGGKNEKILYNHKDEVGGLVQEYNDMVDKLDENINLLARSEREYAWREMARQIAHEIKNPLTPMKLNIQFLQRTLNAGKPEELRERFQSLSAVLIEQIDNMASIASAFSDFAKIPVANCETFDISELIRVCVTLFRNNVDTLECDAESEIMVFADKEQIRRVFINVLKNAIQSIPEGRVGKITVNIRKTGEKVAVGITDNGCGIPEELRRRIFEPNFTTKSGGTGLGLAISRRIIESMDGTIDFISTVDEGTTFFITLNCVVGK